MVLVDWLNFQNVRLSALSAVRYTAANLTASRELGASMNLVADENIPLLDEFFADFGHIERCSGRNLTAAQLQQADVLLVRSVTAVNAALLENTPVRFVGTCTIGTDHIDFSYLQRQQITFASAPGCNAEAVADYVISSLSVLVEQRQQHLSDLVVAVVGVGNVGGRVAKRLAALGLTLLWVDPFKTDLAVGQKVDLAEALSRADVLCLHTPLTTSGAHPTQNLIGAVQLAAMKTDACLLNAGRGPVVNNQALLVHLQQHKHFSAILDVWETEPEPNLVLMDHCLLATPHIAGYSLDGKMRGTEMIYQALCQHLGVAATHHLADFLPEPAVKHLELSSQLSAEQALIARLRAVYDVRNDDGRMRYAMKHAVKSAEAFDALRRDYPLRRDSTTLN